jgi:hypothetical protein
MSNSQTSFPLSFGMQLLGLPSQMWMPVCAADSSVPDVPIHPGGEIAAQEVARP